MTTMATAALRWWPPFAPATAGGETPWAATALVLAGDGIAGVNDGEAARARFSDPFGVAAGANGTIYVADAGDAQRIRGVTPDGRVFTLAGGTRGFGDGPGGAARFDTPSGLAIGRDGTIYVADTGNHAVRRITRDGVVTTLAGDRVAGYRDGPGGQARFNGPVGLAIDTDGRVIVADTYNDRIRLIERDGTVRTVAGSERPGLADGAGTDAQFHTPCGVAVDAAGTIYVADTGNGLIRTIDRDGHVTTPAQALGIDLGRPIGIAVDSRREVYVSDERGRILAIGSTTRTLAGSTPGFRDGPGDAARFRSPRGLAVAGPARLVVADAGNALIRLVADRTRLEATPPASPFIAPRFDVEGFAWQPLLWPVGAPDGPHEIAGTLGEARGNEGAERFHTGIDVRIEDGTLVRAVRDGIVESPISTSDLGSLGEWLRIGSLTYVHIRAGRARDEALIDPARFVATHDDSGALALVRVKRGARFRAGDAIGSVNRFNHVHLNVGWPGEEHNPLRFRLARFEDTIAPTIARGGVRLYDAQGQPLTRRERGRVVVSGRVQVVVDAWDQADGNRPERRLGLYALGYQVLDRKGSPARGFDAVRETLTFDRLSLSEEAARLVYAPGSGIPFYGRRRTRFLYVVTNTLANGVARQGFWDTRLLPPGDYILRIRAADIRENVAVANRDLRVTVIADGANRFGPRPGITPIAR